MFYLTELIIFRPASSAQSHPSGGSDKEQVILALSLNTIPHGLSNGPGSDIEMLNAHTPKKGANYQPHISPAAFTLQDKLSPQPSQGRYPYKTTLFFNTNKFQDVCLMNALYQHNKKQLPLLKQRTKRKILVPSQQGHINKLQYLRKLQNFLVQEMKVSCPSKVLTEPY